MTRLEDLLPSGGENRTYSCSELSRIIGRHPNTLRKYETWGFIGRVPREPNGYRRYDRRLALEALFSVTALRAGFQEWQGRRRMKAMIAKVLEGDCEGAREILAIYRAELARCAAEAAAARGILESWRGRQRGRKAGKAAGGAHRGTQDGARTGGGRRGPARPEDRNRQDREPGPIYRGEAARRIGVAPDTLRDWERSGLVEPGRLANGRRVYSPGDLEKLAVIRVLRQADYSLVGILHLFKGRTAMEDLSFARDRWEETLRGLAEDSVLLGEIVDAIGTARLFPAR